MARPLGILSGAIGSSFLADLSSPNLLSPVLILVLCVAAGLGTVLLLPSRREAVLRKLGGAVLLAAGLIFGAMLIHSVHAIHKQGMSLYFYIFATIATVGAIRVVTHPRPVYSALYFVLTVMASAGLFILLWAEFMAAALVIIYAGAILVTYVFVIMLASQSGVTKDGQSPLAEYDAVSREPLVASAVGFALMAVLLFVIFDRAGNVSVPVTASAATTQPAVLVQGSTQALGNYLFRNQLVNLELSGLILTIAMVGAILIARRRVTSSGVATAETVIGPATPIDDNPHSIPVYGTDNPRAKAFPET